MAAERIPHEDDWTVRAKDTVPCLDKAADPVREDFFIHPCLALPMHNYALGNLDALPLCGVGPTVPACFRPLENGENGQLYGKRSVGAYGKAHRDTLPRQTPVSLQPDRLPASQTLLGDVRPP